MSKWINTKPTQPGTYLTRYKTYIGVWSKPVTVTVVRRGRGLQVQPDGYTAVPMSDIGEDEFWWKAVST